MSQQKHFIDSVLLDYMPLCYGFGDKVIKHSVKTRSCLINYSRDTCSTEHTAEPAVQNTAKGLQVVRACRLNSFDNNSNFNANIRNIDNQFALREIARHIAETLLLTE